MGEPDQREEEYGAQGVDVERAAQGVEREPRIPVGQIAVGVNESGPEGESQDHSGGDPQKEDPGEPEGCELLQHAAPPHVLRGLAIRPQASGYEEAGRSVLSVR
jgi:hypothetical protein